jgi:hypothetical protein
MKWTKFKSDFDSGGPLHRLLKPEDILIKDPGTPVHPAEPDIWVSKIHDPLIDNCFRIYTDQESLKKHMWNGKDLNAREWNFHPWMYFENVPEQYSDEVYFTPVIAESAVVRDIEHYQKKEGKTRSKSSGGGYSPNAKYVPHPYEVFTGGWVHFWDNEVRHGETDHAIYFDWDSKKMNVTVHLFQTKAILNWNVYVKVNPPTSQDPPPVKSPPPYC